MNLLAVALTSLLAVGQTARPVTLVGEVRAALSAHDLTRAEEIVAKRRAEQGNTAEVLEAASWLGRGALAEGKLDQAEKYAVDVQKQILATLGNRPVDVDPKFATPGTKLFVNVRDSQLGSTVVPLPFYKRKK